MNMENIQPCSIAYIRQVGAYGEKNNQTMEQLKNWAKNNHLIRDTTVIWGIIHDYPDITPPENCRYDACISLGEDKIDINSAMARGEILGGRYAVFTIEHTAQAIEKAWITIFLALSARKYALDTERPILERYTAHKIKQHLCEICIPIHE